MKVQIPTYEFKNMLKAMDKIKDRELVQSTDLLIKTKDYDTQFIKSNGETTIIYNSKNTVNEDGQVVLPLETAELIKKLKEGSLIITDDKISTDKKKISFNQLDKIEINTYENINKIFNITQKELLRMLEASYAMAQDNTRPILNGICFNKNETCALDGYRLSLRKSREYESEATFVVNMFSTEILKSILKDTDDVINVYYDGINIVKFEMNNTTLIAKCIEGEFIRYNQIIPDEYNIKSIVKPEEFEEEIEFIKAADERNFLKTIFSEDNKVILKGNQCKEEYNEKSSYKDQEKRQSEFDAEYKIKHDKWTQKGKRGKEPIKKEAKFKKIYDLIPVSDIISEINAINTLDSVHTENGTFTIAYNPNYMSDAIKQYTDKVELRMNNSVSPIVVTNDGENLELVLPVRLRD